MEIKVDFLCGTDIKDAVQQSIDILNILPMLAYVKFDFNGLSVAVNRNSRVTVDMSERLVKAFGEDFKHWIVEAE
jgi:hypothetical protein